MNINPTAARSPPPDQNNFTNRLRQKGLKGELTTAATKKFGLLVSKSIVD